LPATFSTTLNTTASHWSFFGTVKASRGGTTTTTPTTATSPATIKIPASGCTATISGRLDAAIHKAHGGDVICLTSGSFGDVALDGLSKPSDVTVRPAAGATVTIGSIDFNNVSHLHFTGLGGTLKMAGGEVDPNGGASASACSTHLTFDHIVYTAAMNILTRCANEGILIDHDVFDNLGGMTWEGRLNVTAYQTGAPGQPVGVTISNSHFGGEAPGGTCSDGIQVLGDAYGVRIGPGNEFTGIDQDGCTNGAHADPIQVYGGLHTTITGNYFHDNGTGTGGILMGMYSDHTTVTKNVFVCDCVYPYSVHAGATHNSTFTHNTFAGGGLLRFEQICDSSGCYVPSGNLVRDNVFTRGGGISSDGRGGWTNDHNLNSGQPGSARMSGAPAFVGGRSPKRYADYALAPGSPGYQTASDGKSMGITASHGR
jgi:Right handed beta helix region